MTTTIKGPQSQHLVFSRIPTAPKAYNDSDFNQIIDVITQNFDNYGNPTTQVASETFVQIQPATATVDASSGLNLVDTTAGNVTMTLQAASLYIGRIVIFKRITAGANTLTIACTGSDKIDGAATILMPTQWQCRGLKSTGNATGTGSAWIILWSYL